MLKRRHLILLGLLVLALPLLVACGANTATKSVTAANDNKTEAEDHHGEEAGSHHDEEDGHHEDEEAENGHWHDSDTEGAHHEGDHAHDLTTHDPIDGAKEVRVVAKEWGFEPASLHLHEGEAVNIVLVNEGTLEHEVELEAFGFHIHAQPGETVTAGFVPNETGEFEFGCFVPGHYEAGMVGEVVVEHAH